MVKFHRSDIHFWKAGRIGPLIVESDCVLGHEAAGIVLKVGEGVEDFVVGEFFVPFFLFSSCPFILFFSSLSLSPIIVLSWEGGAWKSDMVVFRRD
jgi:NADPH:quinone reductase-like Zn-dependent oxidoreductase